MMKQKRWFALALSSHLSILLMQINFIQLYGKAIDVKHHTAQKTLIKRTEQRFCLELCLVWCVCAAAEGDDKRQCLNRLKEIDKRETAEWGNNLRVGGCVLECVAEMEVLSACFHGSSSTTVKEKEIGNHIRHKAY